MFRAHLLPLLVLVLVSGCAASRAASPVTAPAPPRTCPAGLASARAAQQWSPSLELHVRPAPADAGGAVVVKEVWSASEAELGSLRPPAGVRQPLEVKLSLQRPGCDPATGAPPLQQRMLQAAPGEPLPLGALSLGALSPGATSLGATSGASAKVRLELDYRLEVPRDAPGNVLTAQRFLAEGRQLFFLPPSLGEAGTETLVAIDASAYGSDGRAVSSIGIGAERRAPMTARAIEDGLFAAGYLGSAVFQAPEGQDEWAWFGSTLFDPRPLAAEVASFRSAVRERLNDHWESPLTAILSVEPVLAAFDVRRAPASLLLRLAPGQVLSAQLRLSILHQVLKEWIGGRLRLLDESGVEAVWFTEGLCRYLARQLAFEFGLITPLEYLEELNGLLAIQSVLGEPAHDAVCSAEASAAGGAFSSCRNLLALARGALLAGELDRALSARGTSLAALLADGLKHKAALTPSSWAAALESGAGEPARALLASFARGAPIVPPSTAFGPCFARAPLRLAEGELGFEYRAADAGSGAGRWLVARVPESSPAFAAGLRADTAFSAIDFAPYAADRPVRVLLADGRQLEYRARAHGLTGVAWKRVASVPDPRCLKP